MTKCPSTGADVSTSQHVMADAFERTEFPNAAFRCPVCSQIHRWEKAQAWLANVKTRPPARPAAA